MLRQAARQRELGRFRLMWAKRQQADVQKNKERRAAGPPKISPKKGLEISNCFSFAGFNSNSKVIRIRTKPTRI
jgi:hypothetical protein